MKKFTFFFSFLWLSFVALGQAPQGISYQTVIRDGAGQPLLNTAVTLKMTIRTAAPDGGAVYSETHPKTTGTFSLVTLAIGQGTPVEGNFASIDWGAAPHFLETAIDATGTGDFQILGVTQFLSVPYALNSLNGMPAGNNTGDMLYWDGSQWMKIAVGQNGQALILQNGIPTWGGVQLPILNTAAVTNITAFTAYSGGNIASDGGSPVVGRGICWNTSPNPTTGNFKIFAGSGSGNFLAQMTGLESSTQYFVRAFATNSAGTSYGQEMTFFTTAGAITLSTTAITNITVNSATSGGNITLNGGSPVTARGVCWNIAPYPTLAHNKTTDGTGNGTFVSQLTGLANNTTYYVRAYATNSLGTSYGNQLTFTTLSGIVTLTTAEVTGITANSAISGGEITSDGGSAVTTRGVCWSTLPNPTAANSFTSDGEGTGIFVSTLTGLLEDTTYNVRAYATNAFGTWYGNEVSFETLENLPPSAPNSPQPEDESANVSINQILSWFCTDPESDPLSFVVFFGTEIPPTQLATAIADTFYTPGTLNYNTTYYWKIVANDDHGNSTEGEIWSFTTFEDIGCPELFIDSRDDKSYSVIQIGNQCWMAENLNIGTRIDGSQNQQNNGVIEKYCYNNLESNCDIYGGLYQWKEAMTYSTTQGVRGICPFGWHVPTDNEWCTLEQVVDPIITCSSISFRGVDGGGRLKETNTFHWTSPNIGATNSSGFTALPGGSRYFENGLFFEIGDDGVWWSSSTGPDNMSNYAWYRFLSSGFAKIGREINNKWNGHSMRCLKDNEVQSPPYNPVNPLPETGSNNNSIDSNLSWFCSDPDGDPLTYDVFFGNENPPTQVATAIADTFYNPGTLNFNTTYFWKIVAHDDHGNSTEGEVWSFTTMDEPWQCGDVLVDERDEKEYSTVQIGTQCWMAENLNVGNRVYGGQIQQNNGTIEKYCYSNLEENCEIYGGLYQWNEMMGYSTTQGIKGICTEGWHLPTNDEFLTLTYYLGGESVAGGKMKSTGTIEAGTGLWYAPNTGATNISGFTTNPGGYRYGNGNFFDKGYFSHYCTSSEYGTGNTWIRLFYYSDTKVKRDWDDKSNGYSVRCLKD